MRDGSRAPSLGDSRVRLLNPFFGRGYRWGLRFYFHRLHRIQDVILVTSRNLFYRQLRLKDLPPQKIIGDWNR